MSPFWAWHCSSRQGGHLRASSFREHRSSPLSHTLGFWVLGPGRLVSLCALLTLPGKSEFPAHLALLTLILLHYLFKLLRTIYSSSEKQQLLSSQESGTLRPYRVFSKGKSILSQTHEVAVLMYLPKIGLLAPRCVATTALTGSEPEPLCCSAEVVDPSPPSLFQAQKNPHVLP